jgi:hypothetical protein
MSPRRPELPYTGTTNTLAARTSPCPPVPIPMALFSRVAIRLVEAEIQRAMRRTMPPPTPPVAEWSHAVRATVLWSVAWTATSVLCGIKVWQALTQHDDEIGD